MSNITKGRPKIATAAELRATMLQVLDAVIEGRLTVAQANAAIGVSAEVHKSLKQEWDVHCYAAENMRLEEGKLARLEYINGTLAPSDG